MIILRTKKLILYSLCISTVLAFCIGAILVRDGKPHDQNKTRLVNLSPKSVDFGVVDFFSVNSATVEIQNITHKEISIKVKSGCGCTAVNLENKTLLPGRKTKLTIDYRPAKKGVVEGKASERVLLISDDGETRNYDIIPVEATVARILTIKPAYVDFGDLFSGEEPVTSIVELSVRITDQRKAGFEIIKPEKPYLSTKLLKDASTSTRPKVQVTIDPNRMTQYGEIFETVIFVVKLQKKEHRVFLPIRGYLWPTPYSVTPRIIGLGFVKPQQHRLISCVITSLNGEPFDVTGVSLQNGGARILSISKGRIEKNLFSRDLKLDVNLSLKDQGPFTGKLLIDIRNKQGKTQAVVPLRAFSLGGYLSAEGTDVTESKTGAGQKHIRNKKNFKLSTLD